MAIIRCNKCALLLEQPEGLVRQNIPCPRCASATPVYPTLFFVEKLVEKYADAQRELGRLRASLDQVGTTPSAVPVPRGGAHLPDINLGSTDQFASDAQHGPIYDWFHRKQIKVQANLRSVDTSGFFDEVAESIGANLPVLGDVLERIRWSQQKDYASTTIHLDKKSPEDALAISNFCQSLYDYSFVAKCFHLKPQNKLRLILQNAPTIRKFFNGEWLEWYALMSCLRYAKQRGKRFSCARGLNIELQNGDNYELDVFVLIDGQVPICIECKSGEFRENIDRYLTLKKRLSMDSKHFILCVAGLDEDNAKAFSAMYNLTFVSERALSDRLSHLY
jgi:hypothetical protein